jgi:phage-related protein
MFEVSFFKTAAGSEPVRDWIRGFDVADRSVIGADLRTVQLGFPLGMPLCRALGSGLHEVRSTLPSHKEARLIFFQHGAVLIIVGGFIKKTQATPKREFETAIKRKNEYVSNNVMPKTQSKP